MSCNSAIYTVFSGSQEIQPYSQIPFGSIVRRFGRFVNIEGSDVVIGSCCNPRDGQGYYKCDCSVTLEPAAIGSVTAQLYLNGEAYDGAIATGYAGTAGEAVNLAFPAIVRLYGCQSLGTLEIRTGNSIATVTNMAFTVEKI